MFKCKRRNIAYTCAVDSVPVVDVPGLFVEMEDHVGISIVEFAMMVLWLSDWLELLDSVDFKVFGSCLSEECVGFGSACSYVFVTFVSVEDV